MHLYSKWETERVVAQKSSLFEQIPNEGKLAVCCLDVVKLCPTGISQLFCNSFLLPKTQQSCPLCQTIILGSISSENTSVLNELQPN